MTERRIVGGRVGGFSPWEERLGAAQAIAAGDHVHVAGARPLVDGVLQGEGDPYEQLRAAVGNALEALAAYGLTADDVVRTRVYLTHSRDIDAAGRAHQELFGAVRPVTTLVVVQSLVDSRLLVEVELDAHRAGLAATLEALEGKQP
ncbi:Rid family hydrolase [Kitasatospora sp. NPDC089913]|uniref:Rid family hydrolase n=1 Tax=Streptomycetaceae TaxID=2062 RepID=UPI00087991E3|nr:Rid family hydrolase [Streptomyces sp. TLI_053]SDT78219.1 Enamine deaminase RidA, house cleaning of reactive enamine intermediates, YjgF/YER057c/UK114 family [Streptomyces sp. TLI_053]